MNKIFHKILDFPQMVNQKVLNAKINSIVDEFDTQNGVRSHVKIIYQIAAFVFLLKMEYVILLAAIAFFGNAEMSMISKIGSIFTLLILAYSAFPMAHIIRSRGEGLAGNHNGMVEFLFKDVVTTNIRIFGEIMALVGLFAAFNSTLNYAFDSNLLGVSTNNSVLSSIGALYTFPVDTLNTIFSSIRLGFVADLLNSFFAYKLDATQNFSGDLTWNLMDLKMVANAYINVIIALAALYVNLAIYNFLYTIVSSLISFIPKLAIPIAIRKRNEN